MKTYPTSYRRSAPSGGSQSGSGSTGSSLLDEILNYTDADALADILDRMSKRGPLDDLTDPQKSGRPWDRPGRPNYGPFGKRVPGSGISRGVAMSSSARLLRIASPIGRAAAAMELALMIGEFLRKQRGNTLLGYTLNCGSLGGTNFRFGHLTPCPHPAEQVVLNNAPVNNPAWSLVWTYGQGHPHPLDPDDASMVTHKGNFTKNVTGPWGWTSYTDKGENNNPTRRPKPQPRTSPRKGGGPGGAPSQRPGAPGQPGLADRMPSLDPNSSKPDSGPTDNPEPLSWDLIPEVGSNPWRAPGERTERGYRIPVLEPEPEISEDPDPRTRPSVPPRTWPEFEPDNPADQWPGGVTPPNVTLEPDRPVRPHDRTMDGDPPTDRRPPTSGEKEHKLIANPSQRLPVVRLYNALTEYQDVVDCLYNALPGKVRELKRVPYDKAREGNPDVRRQSREVGRDGKVWVQKSRTIQEKSQLVWRHFEDINWKKATQCLVANEAKDRLFGALGRIEAKASRRLGRRPVGIGTGPLF